MTGPVDTMATNSIIRINAGSAFPSRWSAAVDRTRSESASYALIGTMRAVDVRSSNVAKEKGVVNQ